MPSTWEERTTMFCVYLAKIKEVQSSTIKTYVTAIKSKLVADDYEWNDKLVLLSTFTGVCRLHNDFVRTRFPIGVKLLDMILAEIGRIINSVYLVLMYRTLFLLAYYGLMRIGELTCSDHALKAKDIHTADNKNKILLVLYSSKTHGFGSKPQKIKITSLKSLKNNHRFFCPFEITNKFLQLRGGYDHESEQLMIFADGSPVQSTHVRNLLRKIIKRMGLNPKYYGTHSFRIGRATDLMKSGTPVEKIKHWGRWKSNAVYKYLRS